MYPVIVAFDPGRTVTLGVVLESVKSLCGLVGGFKLGLPFLALYGPRGFSEVRRSCGEGLVIADFKLADIGHVMRLVVEAVSGYIDAVIAHSFVGVEGALRDLKEFLDSVGLKLILVYNMSHPGALETMAPCRERLRRVISSIKPWGVVAPATRPEEVKEARNLFPWAKILSPGVGAQGAKPGTALCAGADYEIIGRMLAYSRDPKAALESIAPGLKRCLGDSDA